MDQTAVVVVLVLSNRAAVISVVQNLLVRSINSCAITSRASWFYMLNAIIEFKVAKVP